MFLTLLNFVNIATQIIMLSTRSCSIPPGKKLERMISYKYNTNLSWKFIDKIDRFRTSTCKSSWKWKKTTISIMYWRTQNGNQGILGYRKFVRVEEVSNNCIIFIGYARNPIKSNNKDQDPCCFYLYTNGLLLINLKIACPSCSECESVHHLVHYDNPNRGVRLRTNYSTLALLYFGNLNLEDNFKVFFSNSNHINHNVQPIWE